MLEETGPRVFLVGLLCDGILCLLVSWLPIAFQNKHSHNKGLLGVVSLLLFLVFFFSLSLPFFPLFIQLCNSDQHKQCVTYAKAAELSVFVGPIHRPSSPFFSPGQIVVLYIVSETAVLPLALFCICFFSCPSLSPPDACHVFSSRGPESAFFFCLLLRLVCHRLMPVRPLPARPQHPPNTT